MKEFFAKVKDKVIKFLKWLWNECKDWRTLVLLGIVCLALSSPIWVFGIIGFVFNWSWALWVAGGVWAFWWLPGAPFFALAVSITLGIKRAFQKKDQIAEKFDEIRANIDQSKTERSEHRAKKKLNRKEKKEQRRKKKADKKGSNEN